MRFYEIFKTIFNCRSYEFVKTSSVEASWKRNWSAAFYLDVETSIFTKSEEFIVFDVWDFISASGGLMGLFIGTSFLGIINVMIDSFENIYYLINQHKNKK